MMRSIVFALLLALLVTSTTVATQIGTAPAPDVPGALPTTPPDGWIGIRKSDLQLFFYTDTLGVYLGEQVVLHLNRNANDHSGAWRIGETNTALVTPGENGYRAPGVMRIMQVAAYSIDAATTAACTTFITAADDSILSLVWDSNTEVWNPAGSGWVAADVDSVTIPSGTVVGAATGAGGTVLPDRPMMWLYLREQVDP
jgi:hypothetical protein